MEFTQKNILVVTEPYGWYVSWALTILCSMLVAICFHYVVQKIQTKQTRRGNSLPQSSKVDEARVQEEQESLTCPICRRESCNDDHESTFLFHREQYKDHVDEEHVNLTQKQGKGDHSLTIFDEINQFKQLKAVTITGIKLDDSSLSNLFQCTSIRTLKLSNCQLASIPRSLANLKDLEILDLSQNKLTTLPTRPIRSLPCLKSLNVSHNKIEVIGDVVKKLQALQNFDVSYNDVGQVPYEILEMESLEIFSCSHNKIERWLGPSNEERQASTSPVTSLNMSNNLLTEVPQHVKELKNLLVVNFSHNKIGANIPYKILSQQISELFYLPSVSILRLGNNNIKTLPPLDTTRLSQNIVLIDLTNNEIGEVPAALLSMPTLRALYLGSNKITKLPADLDLNKLSPTLYDIDLSNNELDDLPLVLCFLPSLKKLDLKQNKISSLSENMKSCKSLSFLDISHNKLKEMPSYVFGLPELRVIDVSNNQITTVSSLRKEESSVVEEFTLAENGLSQFPEVLIQMKKLKKVDLKRNKIKEIPESIMGMPKDVKLQVQDNPIVDPPLQVCQAGLEAIQAFYEDLTTASSITQCLKTLFLGTYEAGKTSLVRVFQLNRSSLTNPEERTHGIDIAEIHLSVPNTHGITLSVWDFAGQETYYMTHQFFLSTKALVLLVVNLETYDSASFKSICGDWLENMIAKVGNPVIIPVATHIDKLSTEEVDSRCYDLARKLEDQERRRVKDLQKQLERIDESLALSKEAAIDRKKQINTLLQKRPSIHPKPVPVSSGKNLEGTQYLKQVILNYAVNKEYFPEVGRLVPKAWADTEACVERKGKELDVPYMTWAEFTSLLKENVPNLQPESRIKTVAQYLHDTGKILWYSEIESLKNHVFLKPASLVDIFRKVIRYNFEEAVDYESDSCYREADITPAEFQKMKIDLVRKGVLHTKLLQCLWSDIKEKCRQGTFNVIFNTLIELMQQFDLCYNLDCEENDSYANSNASISERMLLPWHLKEDLADMAKIKWESGGSHIISLQYQFPSFIPPGLFARLTVRAHNPKHNLHFVLHWDTGALCKHKENRILALLENEGTERLVVSLSVRLESKSEFRWSGERMSLWKTLKALSLEVEELLKQWPGVRFDRFTVCPKCRQPSFPGDWEWLHQGSRRHRTEEVICCFCNERVHSHDVMPTLALLAAADVGLRYIAYSTKVSDGQLLRVAQKLGAEWESLAIHMGFTQADVYKFKCNHLHNAEQQILAMLTAWRDRKGRDATPQNLKRVLREAGVDYDAISSLDDFRPQIVEIDSGITFT